MMSKGCVLTFTPEGAPRTVQPSIANFASQSRVCSAIVKGSFSFHKAAGSRLGGMLQGTNDESLPLLYSFLTHRLRWLLSNPSNAGP